MIHPPKTKEEALRYKYNRCSWNRSGTPYNEARCAYEVIDLTTHQCSRKPVHGPDGLYCKQHAKMVAPCTK